jgi:benzaldehyde dehydrogenase (NAD)
MIRETGAVEGLAGFASHVAAQEAYEAAALASRPAGEILQSELPRLSLIKRVPVGVVGVISPFNVPLILSTRSVAPALALGNAVVLKPSPETPISGGLLLAEIFAAAGLPAGLLQVVPGDVEVGEALVAHPDVSMIHFTGSTRTGRKIAEVAGRELKHCSLELGGDNALVVLDDADVEHAAMIGAWSAWHYQGQTCITAGRHIVARPLYDRYVAALTERAAGITVGDPMDDGVGLGPMINETQRDRAQRMLDAAVAAGAKVVAGGDVDGLFHRPTVVVDVPLDSELWQEEIFAPIAPVIAVDSEEEAVALVNDTPYGLVNGVVTGDLDRGQRVAERLRSGMVHVNDSTCLDEAHAPFGGLGASGLGGRAGGESNLDEFTEQKWLSVQRGQVEYPY